MIAAQKFVAKQSDRVATICQGSQTAWPWAQPQSQFMYATAGAPAACMALTSAARHAWQGTCCWLDSSLSMFPKVLHTSLAWITLVLSQPTPIIQKGNKLINAIGLLVSMAQAGR